MRSRVECVGMGMGQYRGWFEVRLGQLSYRVNGALRGGLVPIAHGAPCAFHARTGREAPKGAKARILAIQATQRP